MKNIISIAPKLLVICLIFSVNHAYTAPKLMAYIPFDTAVGNTFPDSTRNGYNASWTGSGITTVAGLKGKALNCSGNAFEMLIANSNADFNVTKFSIECCFNMSVVPSSLSMNAQLFNFNYVASEIRNGFCAYVDPQGHIGLSLSTSDGSAWVTATSSVVVTSGTWYNLVCTFDSSYLKVFVNGQLSGSHAYSGTYAKPYIDAHIGCTKRTDGTITEFFSGKIDELKFYNYALTADSVLMHLNIPAPVLIPCIPNPTFNLRPVFHWYANGAISTYNLQIATDSLFNTTFYTVPLTDTSFFPTSDLSFGKNYWRVGNVSSFGTFWSKRSSVTIVDSTIPVIIPYVPDPTINRRPTLTWHPAHNIASYTIQINNTPAFSSPYISDVTSDTTYTLTSSLPVGSIFWRVKSTAGTTYSSVDTFTILNDSIPMLIPMTPDTQYIRRPVFTWHSAVGETSYRIQVDTIGNFTSPFISLPLSTDTTYIPTADLPYSKIVWRVASVATNTRYSGTDTFWVLPVSGIIPESDKNLSNKSPVIFQMTQHGITMTLNLYQTSEVSIEIYSMSGSKIATVYKGNLSGNEHHLIWSGQNNLGRIVPAGGYLVVANINKRVYAKKTFILK